MRRSVTTAAVAISAAAFLGQMRPATTRPATTRPATTQGATTGPAATQAEKQAPDLLKVLISLPASLQPKDNQGAHGPEAAAREAWLKEKTAAGGVAARIVVSSKSVAGLDGWLDGTPNGISPVRVVIMDDGIRREAINPKEVLVVTGTVDALRLFRAHTDPPALFSVVVLKNVRILQRVPAK